MSKKVKIVSLDSSIGAGTGGVDLGPSAVRYAGLENTLEGLGLDFKDIGSLKPTSHYRLKTPSEQIIALSKELQKEVSDIIKEESFPLVLGGDHSSIIGTTMGMVEHKKIGIIWFDAHGDANTFETSISQNIHGMSMAILLGHGNNEFNEYTKDLNLSPQNIALIGARSFDEGELEFLESQGVNVYTAEFIKENGMDYTVKAALEAINNDIDGVHISFDLDSLDPMYAPGGGLRVDGGLTPSEITRAFKLVSESVDILSAEFSEINPLMDLENKTAILTVDLIKELLKVSIKSEAKI
ncbi:arginase [Niallia taxi]|uniref:arginase n=1 Tax=Niallia taxi TaxID=2499688 RepID=UPI002040A9FA|nr:arginase [Niallia taxi]MCM3216679.1 arginase [Niallia taxi]